MEIKMIQLIRKGLLILLAIEILLFFIFGIKFLGIFIKSAFFLLFFVVNLSFIFGIYLYLGYKEKHLKETTSPKRGS